MVCISACRPRDTYSRIDAPQLLATQGRTASLWAIDSGTLRLASLWIYTAIQYQIRVLLGPLYYSSFFRASPRPSVSSARLVTAGFLSAPAQFDRVRLGYVLSRAVRPGRGIYTFIKPDRMLHAFLSSGVLGLSILRVVTCNGPIVLRTQFELATFFRR